MESSELNSVHLAVYALYLLGGSHRKVHTEDVAVKCLEIAPERFKWEKYDYPDKELVRKALFHASEKKHGSLIVGRTGIEQRGKSRDGWQLTPAGAQWVRQNEQRLQSTPLNSVKPDTVPKREADRFLRKLRDDPAYRAFEKSKNVESITRYMFTDFLNCSPDASPETIRTKFQRLLSNAELVGDQSILDFLKLCERQFSVLMAAPDAPGVSQ